LSAALLLPLVAVVVVLLLLARGRGVRDISIILPCGAFVYEIGRDV
jgi:hypothetical protein